MTTLNVKGLKQAGKWNEIETWMKKNEIDILALQETHMEKTQDTKQNTTHGILVEKTSSPKENKLRQV